MKPLGPLALVGLVFAALGRGSVSTAASPRSSTGTDTVACADTLRARDTIPAIVKVSVRQQDTTAKLPKDFELLFADEFRSRFKPPSQLSLIVVRGDRCDSTGKDRLVCAGATPMIRVVAYAMASPIGTIPELHVFSPSLNTNLADSVQSVLVAMGNAKAVPFFESDKTLPITIAVSAETEADSVPVARQLFRIRLPHYRAQFRGAWVLNNARPQYPRTAERLGLGDSLEFEFTILPDGRVAPQSIDVVRYHYKEFLEAVADALPKSIFKPATLAGCPVPEWVKQRFEFSARQRVIY